MADNPPPEATGIQRAGYRKPPVEHQFQKGNAGRRKGSRNKLGEAFITALCESFDEHGEAVIEEVRKESPATFLKVVAKLMPQHLQIEDKTGAKALSDEQLERRIIHLSKKLGFVSLTPDKEPSST